MVFSKGHSFIAIEMNDLIGGKKPGLYIGEGYQIMKVGTFSSDKRAKSFQDMLEYMFGSQLVKEEGTEKNA